MKTLYLIFSKLISLIQTEFFLFTVMTLGLFSCNLMFTYTYGIVIQANEKDIVPDIYLYRMEDNYVDLTKLEELLDRFFADADYYSIFDDSINGGTYSIRARKDLSVFYLNTGRLDELNQEGTVVAPYASGIKTDNKVILNGIEFRVVGTSTVPSFLMSLQNYKMAGFSPEIIAIDSNALYAERLYQNLSQQMNGLYKVEINPTRYANENTVRGIILAAVIYLLCILAFLYLLTAIYDDIAYELNLYKMLGATQGKTILVLSAVMFVLLAGSSLLAQVVHAALYEPFFRKMNLLSDFEYTLGDYALISLLTLGMSFLFVLLYLCVRTRKSVIENAGIYKN